MVVSYVFSIVHLAVKVSRDEVERIRDKWVAKLVEGGLERHALQLGEATVDKLIQGFAPQ